MVSGQVILEILRENRLYTCAEFIEHRINEVNLDRFVQLICSPQHEIHIPLACITWNLNISNDDVGGAEMDQLLKSIDVFQTMQNLSEQQVGQVLDHILKCHIKYQVIHSVPDLIQIFCLLQSPNSTWILDLLSRAGPVFWNELFNRWIGGYGGNWLPPQVVDLLHSADISRLQNVLHNSNPKAVQEFFKDFEAIQTGPNFLLNSDWQRIVGRQDDDSLSSIHVAVIGRCFLNWMADIDPAAHSSSIPMDIVSVVMTLVQEKQWRFRDVEKLFRFSKRTEDLPGLLAALLQILEGELASKALDRLPSSPNARDVAGMMENDRQFQQPTGTLRADAIRIIADSDFNRYNHSEDKITQEQLTQLISDFDDAYNGSGNKYANVARAVKAVEKFFNVKMRDVQIFGILLATTARRANVSRLLQMQTGEGKTYVIAALAISEVLNGCNVDIITSSQMLAITQTEELKNLYASVGVTVRHNCDEDRKGKETSKVYEANVVYGTAASFMFDVLYEEFWGSKIRCGRGFPLAIVDEVDAQMLDHANHVCRFASSASGMGNLLGIQAVIWMVVTLSFNALEFKNGVWVAKHGEETTEIDDQGTLRTYFKGMAEGVEKMVTYEEGDSKRVLCPKSLEKLCDHESPEWLANALESHLKKPDFDYCVEDDQIVIVDSAKSGTRNKGMRWSGGLHQFLEMRHATKLRPESLTMCFLSTMSFCRRYKTNVIGLTGTIGGAASRKFLHEVYNVDFVEIPPFMVWRHLVLPHTLCENEQHWLQTIVDKTVVKLEEGRACLVITQYIHFAEIIARRIREKSNGRVVNFTGGGADADISGKIAPGTVIVATNVAGRGTDFKISKEVEQAGGLHVMLTSLPENDRVERQNIGRSSRCGERGTSQLVLNIEHINGRFLDGLAKRVDGDASHTMLVNKLKEIRDEWVMECVKSWIDQMAVIQRSDTALTEFISMRKDVVERFKDIGEKIEGEDKSYVQKNIESALNIRFGIYQSVAHSALDPDKIRGDFADLAGIRGKNDITKCFSDYVYPIYAAWNLEWKPRKNPEEFQLAQKLLDRAIECDPLFSGAAYYFRAYSFIFCYASFDEVKYIREAIEDLKLSRAVLNRLSEQYELIMAHTKKKGEDKTKLASQMERLMTLSRFIVSNIEHLIGRDVDKELKLCREMIDKKEGDVSQLEKTIRELEENRETLEKGVLVEAAEGDYELDYSSYKLKDMLPDTMDVEVYKDEIDYFENEGYFRLMTIKRKKKINWWDVIGVGLLGILQLVVGGLLVVYGGGFGQQFGVDLMMMGCEDIFIAIKSGIIDRDFDWKTWGENKLIDVTISLIANAVGGLASAASKIRRAAKVVKIGSQVTKQSLKLAGKQAAKTAVHLGAKIAISEVVNATIAGPLQQEVADLLTGGIQKALSAAISENPDLRHIVDVDNHNNNRQYSSEFVSRATDHFYKQFTPEFLERFAKGIGKGVQGNKGVTKAVKTSITMANVAIIVKKVADHVDHLPGILKEVAKGADGGGTFRHDDRVYEQKGELSVDSVVRSLAANIADFCAAKAVTKATDFFSSKVSKMVIDTGFKKTDKQLERHRKAFINSDDVAQRARSQANGRNEEDKAMLGTIAKIAEDPSRPGDRLQTKYLAEIVGRPIEINYKDANGKQKQLVLGEEFSKKSPIRLKYEPGVNGQPGHYSFADGSHAKQSGKNTCLFDTVTQVTKYTPHELKKAVANFMLDDYERVKNMYKRIEYADLLVGGVRQRGPPRSVSAIKHVDTMVSVLDVLGKANAMQAGRRIPQRTNSVVDHDLEKFDTQADAHFDTWKVNNPNAQPPPGRQNVQCLYVHDTTNIYEVRYPRGSRVPNEIRAFRGEAAFNVEEVNGPVHFNNGQTVQQTMKLPIWHQGDPTNILLSDVFVDHPNHGY